MLLSNSCLVLPAVVKQQQEEISRNHVPSLFAVSVYYMNFPTFSSLTETSTSPRPPQLATALCVIYYICRTPQSQLAKRACFVHSWAVDGN